MNCLMFYGQLRTFKDCLPTILNFIDYDKINYDVFILLDKNNDINYSQENLDLLISMLGNNRIKLLLFTDDIIDNNIENKIVDEYFNKCDEIKKKFNHNRTDNEIITNYFVSKLYYRRHILTEYVKKYCNDNNILYNNCILTRFDIFIPNISSIKEKIYKNDTFIMFDVFVFSNYKTILNIFKFVFDYFSLYKYIDKHSIENFKNRENLKDDIKLKNFIKMWICMPELNLEYYLILNNIQYEKILLSNLIKR